MNQSQASFSDLTSEQIEQVKSLESKLNNSSPSGQETILIAYDNPK
jgi:hypothetical protein